jgi:hypothetical protein
VQRVKSPNSAAWYIVAACLAFIVVIAVIARSGSPRHLSKPATGTGAPIATSPQRKNSREVINQFAYLDPPPSTYSPAVTGSEAVAIFHQSQSWSGIEAQAQREDVELASYTNLVEPDVDTSGSPIPNSQHFSSYPVWAIELRDVPLSSFSHHPAPQPGAGPTTSVTSAPAYDYDYVILINANTGTLVEALSKPYPAATP